MKTIEQIQEKIYIMQQKNYLIEKTHREVLTLQSEIDTLVIDMKYDHQVENFMMMRRA
jgi:hypothetical protein